MGDLVRAPLRVRAHLAAKTSAHPRLAIAGGILALGLFVFAGWQGISVWRASHVALERAAFDERSVAVIEELNARIDTWLARYPDANAAASAAERQDLTRAVMQMRSQIEVLELEASELRNRLATTDPLAARTRDALANTLFRLDSLREQAEALAAAPFMEVVKIPANNTGFDGSSEAADALRPVGTAEMTVTPAQLQRAREIGEAYHRRQQKRFAGVELRWLPSSAGTLEAVTDDR